MKRTRLLTHLLLSGSAAIWMNGLFADHKSESEESKSAPSVSSESTVSEASVSSSSVDDSASSIVESVSSSIGSDETRKLSKNEIKANRKAMKANVLDRVLLCAVQLIENQHGGEKSVFDGLNFIDTATRRVNSGMYSYADLVRECRNTLKKYHKMKVAYQDVDLGVLTQKIEALGRPDLASLVRLSANPRASCKSGGADLTVGAFFSVSLGWKYLSCRTPLGQKFLLSGPKVGAGVGLGANLDAGSSLKDRTVSVPLHQVSHKISSRTEVAFTGAMLGGVGDVEEEGVIAHEKIGVGVGFHETENFGVLFRHDKRPDFQVLYRLLNLPFD